MQVCAEGVAEGERKDGWQEERKGEKRGLGICSRRRQRKKRVGTHEVVTRTNRLRRARAFVFGRRVPLSCSLASSSSSSSFSSFLRTSSATSGTSRRLETSLDTGDGPRRSARRARHEEESVVLGQGRVRRLARLALFQRGEYRVSLRPELGDHRVAFPADDGGSTEYRRARKLTVTYSMMYRRRTFSICSVGKRS